MSFADALKKKADEAPAAGFVNVNFGALRVEVNVITWKGSGKEGDPRTPDRFPFTEGMELEKNQDLELTFIIGIDKINPAIDFEYKRNVVVKKTSADGNFKTDWSEIVLPSLVKTFGENWAAVITDVKKPVYVAAEHVDSVVEPKAGRKNYGVPRFISKFKNLAECAAARKERYPDRDNVEEDVEIGIPAGVVASANSLLASLGGNQDKLKEMLASHPFGNYDPDAIIAEMNAK